MSNLWQVEFIAPAAVADGLEATLGDEALAITRFEASPDGHFWRLTFLFMALPNPEILAQSAGNLPFSTTEVQAKDWVAHSQRALPPIAAGRFYLHGSHDPAHPLPHIHDLLIDAGQAFGTGRHETTRGCLLMLDQLVKRKTTVKNILDLGCGSGVLALAALRAKPCRATASDNDPTATTVAHLNAHANQLQARLKLATAQGFRHRTIAARAPYDLIFANILARPLVSLAPALAHHLSPDGYVILSGLLNEQEPQVRNAYRRAGLHFKKRLRLGNWTTLLMQRRMGKA